MFRSIKTRVRGGASAISLALALASSGAWSDAAAAQTTLEKVRAQGFVQCGSTARPGLAAVDGKDEWSGLEVEVCRAVATAVFGPSARFAYHRYESGKDYDTLRDGSDQIAFLSFSEMNEQGLNGRLLPGPTVFTETHDVLVATGSEMKHTADLAGSSTCFIIGTAPENALDAWLAARSIELTRFAFQEEGEMYDAYAVQRCKSLVGESTTLASVRLDGGINHLKSRLLPEHLAAFPIVAATPLQADSQWAAIVAWTIHTLVAADQKETTHIPDGVKAMALDGAALGLDKDWQKIVVATVGSYGAIFKRTLGEGSPLRLAPGLNASVDAGGILTFPHHD